MAVLGEKQMAIDRQQPTGSKPLLRTITGPEPYAESPRISLHATGPRLRLLAATDQETAASSNRQALARGQIHPQIDRSPENVARCPKTCRFVGNFT